jgi:hypothetical protein
MTGRHLATRAYRRRRFWRPGRRSRITKRARLCDADKPIESLLGGGR